MTESHFRLLHTGAFKDVAVIKKSYSGIEGFDQTISLDKAVEDYMFILGEIEKAAGEPYSYKEYRELLDQKSLQVAGKLYCSNIVEHRGLAIVGRSGLEASCTLEIFSGAFDKKVLVDKKTHGSFYLALASPRSESDLLYRIASRLEFVSMLIFQHGGGYEGGYSVPRDKGRFLSDSVMTS